MISLARVLVLLQCLLCSEAADPNKPHEHRGLAPPFAPGPPSLILEPADLAVLKAGKTVKRQMLNKETGSGVALAVQDVDAPALTILGRILDFSNYPRMVNGVAECGNYKETTYPNKTQVLMTRMVLKVPMFKFIGFFRHTYYPALSSVVWTLDYDRSSDFLDSVGYWYVAPHPDDPARSRVFYSVNLMPGAWVPDFVVGLLQRQALDQVTVLATTI